MKTLNENDYYGNRFDEDRDKAMRRFRDDVEKAGDLGKVLFVIQARAMFFHDYAHWPEPMKAALETAIGCYLFDKPFTMDSVRPSTEHFETALGILASGAIPIDEERGKQLVEILNIGAK